MSDKARLAAFNAVKRIFEGAYSNLILPEKGIQGIDRAFAENIMLGTLERKVTLEYIIHKFVNRETSDEVLTLIMTGIYQIIYMDRVPDSAACNETVAIASELFGQKTAGFVNAVLRNVCRKKSEIISDIDNSQGYIKYSADKALFDLISSQYGEETDRIFQAFLGKAPIFLRVNSLKSNAKTIANKVGGEVIGETCVKVNDAGVAVKLIDDGDFYIQGLASQKAVELLDAQPNETVIDVCACPGGKSLGAAIDMQNSGRIYSFDLHEKKLPLITKSAKRLGIDIIKTAKQDGKEVRQELIGVADKVICDVPCSGTGVMGSKPEIKYKSPENFKGIYPTQKAIIRSASQYLKNGGVMVYSTCSINKAENENIINEFLAENKSFRLISQRTVLPYENEGEGFYMAKLIREI